MPWTPRLRRLARAAAACSGVALLPFAGARSLVGVPFAGAGAVAGRAFSATLRIDVDGAMAPVAARIELRCEDSGGQPMTHMLGFGGTESYSLVADSPISVSRTFDRTTEVRGLCRDARGGSHPVLPRVVFAIDAAGQRDSVRALGNGARRARGAGPLAPDPALDSLATGHARDMAEREYFGHVTPEGRDLEGRLKKAGITYATAAENIAGNASAAGAVRAWLDSPGHRRNLLDPVFERSGVGVHRTPSSPYTYYVQIFAK